MWVGKRVCETCVVPAENPFAATVVVGIDLEFAVQRRGQFEFFRKGDNLVERIENPRLNALRSTGTSWLISKVFELF
jgi:hypothetical protein